MFLVSTVIFNLINNPFKHFFHLLRVVLRGVKNIPKGYLLRYDLLRHKFQCDSQVLILLEKKERALKILAPVYKDLVNNQHSPFNFEKDTCINNAIKQRMRMHYFLLK